MTDRIKITKELLVEVAKFLFTSEDITKERSDYLVVVAEQILTDSRDIERINDMMAELNIKPPLELWLASSLTWKEKAKKYDILSKISGSNYKQLQQSLEYHAKLEQENKELKEDLKFTNDSACQTITNYSIVTTERDNLKQMLEGIKELQKNSSIITYPKNLQVEKQLKKIFEMDYKDSTLEQI